jgi:outer membrane protein assembly complex protein YaeT
VIVARAVTLIAALFFFAGCALTRKQHGVAGPPGAIRFEGNASSSDQELADVIAKEVGDLSRAEYRISAVDDAAYGLEQFYAARGFAFARVAYRIVEGEEPLRVVFTIEEGPRVHLDAIRFQGNKRFKGGELRDLFPRPVAPLIGRAPERYYVRREIKAGSTAVESFYYSRGFLDVVVGQPDVQFSADRTHAAVTVSIQEGEQHILEGIEITGASESELPELQKSVAKLIGGAFTPRLESTVRGRVREWYLHDGRPDVRVTVQPARLAEKARRTIVLEVEPGPYIRIAGVHVSGAKRTRGGTLRRLFGVDKGDLYDVEEERDGFRQLYQSGLFRSVDVSLEPPEEPPPEDGPGRRWYRINVEEAPSREFWVEPGYGSYERLRLGLGYRERNLFGTGKTLNTEATVGEKAQRGKIGLIWPRIFDLDATGDTSIFGNRREEPSFTSEEVGFGMTLTRRFTERISASAGYQYRLSSATDVKVATAAVDNLDISSILFSPTYDSRDSVVLPRNGNLTKLAFEYGDAVIGSELDFARGRITESNYFPTGSRGSIAGSWRAGIIAPFHSSHSIPLQERFFNGGENTVRSFKEDELGPADAQGNPIGGEAFHVFSVEWRQNLIGSVDSALFADAGNVELDYEDFFKFHDMRYALGIGLRYVLPVGPIRVDWGYNPDRRSGESQSVLHVSVGMAF